MSRGRNAAALVAARPLSTALHTFEAFKALAVKTKPLTVKETFMQQLMQMGGMTAAKAAAIVGVYPTPRSLMAALDAEPDDKAREGLLKSLKFTAMSGSRNLGPAVAQCVNRLYSDHTLR